MRRTGISQRRNWEARVEERGLVYHHHPDGTLYWDERAYYSFSDSEIEVIEEAANELILLCIEAVDYIIREQRYERFDIPIAARTMIELSKHQDRPTMYGRFDLAYDGKNPPKLLEFNADTPTALLEASVIQWFWLQDLFSHADQFNSVHERLVESWSRISSQISQPVYFACMEDETGEDVMTTTYMRETAEEAGLATEFILMDQIGRASDRGFLDLEERPIRSIFKLYPWEWILKEKFGRYAIETYPNMIWIEPIWKMLLSNKAILAVLWELFPNHPNLLETYSDGPRGMREYVRKPALGREGANIFAQTSIGTVRTGGSYGSGLHVYQKFSRPRIFDGVCPIIGGWVVDNAAAGMGIRESAGIITDSHSQFVPHIIE